MLPDPKIRCPATGFTKSCRAIVSKYDCPKFVKISGVNPNDNQPVDKFGCIDSFIHMLMIENSKEQRHTCSAVESFRNEVVSRQQEINPYLSIANNSANPNYSHITNNDKDGWLRLLEDKKS